MELIDFFKNEEVKGKKELTTDKFLYLFNKYKIGYGGASDAYFLIRMLRGGGFIEKTLGKKGTYTLIWIKIDAELTKKREISERDGEKL